MAIKEFKFNNHIYKISYEILNPLATRNIIILHGWGANKEIMKKAFGNYLKDFKHIYIDLPGFGNSPLDHPLNTKKYANIINEFLSLIDIKPLFIIGHSYGGKVATLLNPPNLVLLSSAGIVLKKPLSIRLKIAVFKTLKKIGFKKFYSFFYSKDVANMSVTMYETLKNVVDEDFSKEFGKYSGKALIFWGKNDKATPLKNGEKINRLIKHSELFDLQGDHFFFLLHAKFISGVIMSSLESDKDELH